MKLNKKTIIILIVVAVALFLLWKKGVFTKKQASTTTTLTPGTLDYILANVDFTAAELAKINAYKAAVEASTTRREAIQAKADQKGHTFDQQLVLDAIWVLYHPKEAWIAGPDGSTDYGWKLQHKVLNA